MRYLGVDYGSKRIGLAISDESGALAFPKMILKNDSALMGSIKQICDSEKIGAIVLGESYSEKGEPNKIMVEIEKFKNDLSQAVNLPISMEREFMTSVEARRYREDNEPIDSSAAALILQRYLDKLKFKN